MFLRQTWQELSTIQYQENLDTGEVTYTVDVYRTGWLGLGGLDYHETKTVPVPGLTGADLDGEGGLKSDLWIEPIVEKVQADQEVLQEGVNEISGELSGTVMSAGAAPVAGKLAKQAFKQSRASSRRLRKALDASGKAPAEGFHSDHIVAGQARGAKDARRVLEKYEIDINSDVNGIFLPSSKTPEGLRNGLPQHERMNTDDYYKWVNSQLKEAGSRDDAIDTLRDFGRTLTSGEEPWKKGC